MDDLHVPIALRRSRRYASIDVKQEEAAEPCTQPKTPRRTKKTVRFSDPGPVGASSSGLTPMIRRASVQTPRRRRCASTPSRSIRGETPAQTDAKAPSRGSAGLHHTLDGRVERRIRRSNLRDLLNKLEAEKKRHVRQAQSEIKHLQSEIRERDREIYEYQNATVAMDTERIWHLEQQIEDLKKRLAQTPDERDLGSDWGIVADKGFLDDGAADLMAYDGDDDDDDVFGDATMAHFVASTPSRGRGSFPTPPATSPMVPATPSSRHLLSTPRSHTGVQACLPDPARQRIEQECVSLQLEVGKLTATLDSYKNMSARLKEQLAGVQPIFPGASNTDMLEGKVAALLQDMSDHTTAAARLSRAIVSLGFPGADVEDMIASLATGFRAARLELEYLTPGEISLPLTSQGAEVLDLLLTRLRELAKKAKEDEACIDEYHEMERSLRKQLDARVTVMDELRADMAKAERLVEDKNAKVQELLVANERLKGAVDTYVRDMSELERLVERMEREHGEAAAVQDESQRRELSEKDASIRDLEERLADALRQTTSLQKEIDDVQDSTTRHVVSLNQRHGKALALRDSRVLELRDELERVSHSLRLAHETMRVLRVEKGRLQAERDTAKTAVDSIKTQLERVLQLSQELVSNPRSCDGTVQDQTASSPVVSGRNRKKMRRRHDSGLGFLEEDEADIF